MPPPRVYRSTQERRREIIDATIETVAEVGFGATTFARIREQAGLSSTRMISYHFADKASLMSAVIEQVVADAAAAMVPAMEAEATVRGKLTAYVRSNLRFLADHRAAARAVVDVIRSSPPDHDSLRADTSVVLLAVLLSQGQEAGEFRSFDSAVVARSIRAVIDAFATTMPAESRIDDAIEEIVTLVDRATRTEGELP